MRSAVPPPAPSGQRDPGERSRILGLGLALLLLGTAGAFILGRKAAEAVLLPASLGRGGVRQTPDLVGRDLEGARKRALEAGSSLDVLGVAYGTEADSGEILTQFPPEGMPLEEGQPVEVLIGAGPGIRRVPDVRGLPESEARALLEEAGIPVAAARRVSDESYGDGAVAGTDPEVGSRIGGEDSVALLVSHAGAVVEVPDVRGRTRAEAEAALHQARLTVGAAARDDGAEPGPEDVVVAQDPPAGGLARSGATVDLRIGAPSDSPD